MQLSTLDNRKKSKILAIAMGLVLLFSIPTVFQNFENGYGMHIAIHMLATILALFLSIVGWITFRQFKNGRLALVFCAFATIAIMETVALFSFTRYEPTATVDTMITHSLILLMLIFFSVGIFRND